MSKKSQKQIINENVGKIDGAPTKLGIYGFDQGMHNQTQSIDSIIFLRS
jgi:hypothetical protein